MDRIRRETGIEAKLKPSGGGVFEVTVDNDLIFSKKSQGRFPEESEIIAKIR